MSQLLQFISDLLTSKAKKSAKRSYDKLSTNQSTDLSIDIPAHPELYNTGIILMRTKGIIMDNYTGIDEISWISKV